MAGTRVNLCANAHFTAWMAPTYEWKPRLARAGRIPTILRLRRRVNTHISLASRWYQWNYWPTHNPWTLSSFVRISSRLKQCITKRARLTDTFTQGQPAPFRSGYVMGRAIRYMGYGASVPSTLHHKLFSQAPQKYLLNSVVTNIFVEIYSWRTRQLSQKV